MSDMSEWIDRVFCFVPEGQRQAANVLAAQLDPDEGGILTFDLARSFSDDGETVTHRYINSQLKATGVAAIPTLAAQIPGSLVYLQSHGWTQNSAISDAGLVEVFVEDE